MSNASVLRPEMFVSYSSKDRPLVQQLVADLAKHGVTLWYDRWAMGPGDKLLTKIGEGIQHCKYFGVVVSRDSLESQWVQHELDAAMIRFIEDKNIRIIPIITGDVDLKKLPIALRGFIYVDLREMTPKSYKERVKELVDAIILPQPSLDPAFKAKTIRGPRGGYLEDELLAFATDPDLRPENEDDLRSKWAKSFCRTHRDSIAAAIDYLIDRHYSDPPAVQDLMQCMHAIFSTHQLDLRQLPSQMLRVIDDDELEEGTRAVGVQVAGYLDYPLGEERLGRLLSRKWNRLIYAVCEYIEYRVGILESEDLATRLLAVLNRPDSVAYFSATHSENGAEVDADVRYYAARCLALAELKPEMEAIIVDVVRKKYPEVEDEVFTLLMNAVALGALHRSESRLWKRYSGKMESAFDRVDERTKTADTP